ncbi:MAG: DNA-protecting protein DprA [Proteobacteria bacterium]|nr:DNA-protecting protein DprA [Pseudomonadota bacterium]
MNAQRMAHLRLARTTGVGPVGYRKLLIRHGSALQIVAAWENTPFGKTPLCDEALLKKELELLHAAGGWMLLWGEEDYPAQLAELPDAPLVLSGLGDATLLKERQVAMVGNRSASAAGLAWSRTLAEDLAHAGVVVTSGLARGIDTVAHEGALNGGGKTVAVVAGGVNHIYPPENAALREKIIKNGCVVSEQAFGMAPTAQLFPRRNRIIAGLAVGVVVSEAGRHSGSLITAECALNYGREVWAVPGSPGELRSGGPNWLLKNGAALVETARDIINQMPATPAPYVKRAVQQENLFDLDEVALPEEMAESMDAPEQDAKKIVFALLGNVPVGFDELVRQTGLDGAAVGAILGELELDGHAAREADGRWRRG